ncbi:MAG: ATP-dependent sacrificial sulfur transferase LarE [Planctomycetota bacterium]
MVLASKVQALTGVIRGHGSLLVALSGGVDSAVLVALSARALPGRVVAATTVSAAVPDEEVAEAARIAALCGVPHRVVATHELEDPAYAANDGRRCYFCRRSMYGELGGVAAAEGLARIADGLQADDVAGDRPGVQAATEHAVLHPLREVGLGKRELRRLAWGLGLPVHDKPAQPCLASRLPVGVRVTAARLAQVDAAERVLRARGYRELRVRCETAHARIEIGVAELARARAEEQALIAAVCAAGGFASGALDPRGYLLKSGSSPSGTDSVTQENAVAYARPWERSGPRSESSQ